MYTRKDFGLELKTRVEKKEDLCSIAHWAYSIYLEHIEDIDFEFRNILLALNAMEDGPEFQGDCKKNLLTSNSF